MNSPLANGNEGNGSGCVGELMRIDDAARYLGISTQRLRALVRRRAIAYRRVGKFLMWYPSDLDEFRERSFVPAEEPEEG
ncbi:MAG: helix-turn-helix domain-containing protein [Acidimicrobiales bacterium]